MLIKFCIKNFLEDRKFNNCSSRTITSYDNTLKQFHSFCLTKEIVNFEDISSTLVKSYLNYCIEERKNTPTSINHKIIDLKAFCNYSVKENQMNEKQNPCSKISKLKTDIRIEAFTNEQVLKMLNYFRKMKGSNKSYYSIRDYVIILTLLGTGIRLGELVNIKWQDIDLIANKITVFGKKRVQRTIPLITKLRNEIVEWKLLQSTYFQDLEVDSVFSTWEAKKMSENAVGNMFKRLKEIMGFRTVRLSAHTFRHTFAKNWIMSNGDQFSLQQILGHSSVDMVNRYVSLFGSAIKVSA